MVASMRPFFAHNIKFNTTMRTLLFCLVLSAMLYPDSLPAKNYYQDATFRVIEDFESDSVGKLPDDWYNRSGERKPVTYKASQKESYQYQVLKEDGNHFLRYEGTSAKHLNYPLKNKDWVNIHETPYLSWKWRVHDLPEGANEDINDKNDAAASVYVVYDIIRFVKIPKVIRYTWSTSLPEGEVIKKNMGYQKIIVMKSGAAGLGQWHSFERNIVDDFEKYFGKKPDKKPLAILILSDGDSTGDRAMGDYDDFILSSQPRTSAGDIH